MTVKIRRGKPIVRFAFIGGAALLTVLAIVFVARLQFTQETAVPVHTPQLTEHEVPRIGLVEAFKTRSIGSTLFIDLRSRSAFARTHIPGAISISAEELERSLPDLPADQAIIVYGDYELEETSVQAVLFLITHGFPNSTSLRGGIEGWIQSGYPIDP